MTRGWAPPPMWLLVLAWLLMVTGVVLSVVGAVDIGITVDETYHVTRLGNFFDRGWYLLDDDFSGRSPGPWVEDAYVYGPAATLPLHVLNVLVGSETWGTVSISTQAYVVRHLGVAAMGLVGALATAWITRTLSGSWRWGVVSASVLLCLPMWTGHAMFNVKDVPVGTGYTLVTAGVMATLDRRSGPCSRVLAEAAVLVGVFLAVGTRPAIWPGVASAVCLPVAIAVLTRRSASPQPWRPAATVLGMTLVAMTLLALVYPAVFADPSWMMASVTESSGYAGQRVWGYIPAAVVVTVPSLLLVVGLSGLFGRFLVWVRDADHRTSTAMVLVLLQALLIPGLLTLRPSAMHEGLRHVLFAAPAVAVLLTAGLEQLHRDLARPLVRRGVGAVVAFALLLPAAVQAQTFPYGYGHSNGLADAVGIAVASDAWQASFHEYADVVSTDDFVICGAHLDEVDRPTRTMTRGGPWMALSEDCTEGNTVLAPFLDPDERGGDGIGLVGDHFVALMYRFDPPPRGCVEIDRVTRRRLFRDQTLSTALLCPTVVPAYAGPITLTGAGVGSEYLLGGWDGRADQDAIGAQQPATLGFDLGAAPDRLVLEVLGEGEIDFLVNNVPAEARRVPGGWRLLHRRPVPAIGASPGNVFITIVPVGEGARVSRVAVVDRDGS